MGTELLVLLVLILINAFFAASEMAFVSLNDNKIKVMAEEGHKKAILVQSLLKEPSRFLATIQIGITLAGFLASAFAAGSFAEELAEILIHIMPLSPSLLETISTIIITLILSYFTLVFGELVPKRIALQKAEKISFTAVYLLIVLSKITAPFVKFLSVSTNSVVRIFGLDPKADSDGVTEEEIRMMVDVGQEKGTIQQIEKEMINNIFEFDDKTVSDIMTHRMDIVAIPVEMDLKEVIHIANVKKFTRIPVFEHTIDNIIGILHVKDLFQFIENGEQQTFQLRKMAREPYFVLESMKINRLFTYMQKNNIHMAIVVDEYGGTDGIVTIEDLVEEIVGNIFDEYDEPELEEREVEKLDPHHYILSGALNLYEVEDILDMDLTSEDYDTLSGFMIGKLGYIPEMDEHPQIEYKNIIFSVQEMEDKRIAKVKVTVREPKESD